MCLSSDYVRCVAFKPDNPNIVVSGSDDETIKTWDITSGSCLSTLSCDSAVLSVDWHDNCIAAGDVVGKIYVFDAAAGKIKSSLIGHSHWVYSVAWSPDGTKLASGSRDATVRIWEAATGKQLWQLRGHRYAPSLSKECFLSFG